MLRSMVKFDVAAIVSFHIYVINVSQRKLLEMISIRPAKEHAQYLYLDIIKERIKPCVIFCISYPPGMVHHFQLVRSRPKPPWTRWPLRINGGQTREFGF